MDKEIKNFYTKTLGFYPYEYQLKVAKLLLGGKNVILSVPTGAGKTWASIVPFMYANQIKNIHFPQKLIYNLPLRALTNSIYEDVSKIATASIQTGEYSEDKYFEKDIIFSTIDQTLSNFLCFPLALSQRQANINAGALIGSYLVFDEFHLLDTSLSMATTLGMLKMLGNLCRSCIMTATMSEEFMSLLKANFFNYEIVTLDDFRGDKEQIGSLLPKTRKKEIKVLEEVISAQRIIEKHQKKTIVLCNRVETAQEVYNEIIGLREELKGLKKDNIICLHSRFFDDNRREKERRLRELFGKETDKNEQAILIATQVIEAGMNISCDVMHTEISPINSFLQRAGRCARFDNEIGKIFIYNVLELKEIERVKIKPTTDEDKDEIRKINNKYLPYNKTLCQITLNELKKYRNLDGDIPKKIIEKILGEKEKKIIRTLESGQGGGFNQDKIRESWHICQKNYYRSTIRDIQNIEVTLISDKMYDEVAKSPFRFQSLGMYKWSLVGWLNKILKNEGPIPFDEEDWLVRELKESNFIDDIENDEGINYQLTRVTDFQNMPSQVYLNAKYFGYKDTFGFNWQYVDSFDTISPKRERKEDEKILQGFLKDTFYQHNMGLIRCFEMVFENKLDFAITELVRYIEVEELQKEDFIEIIKLMIILHDYGKLNEKWQKPMQIYQALKEGIAVGKFKEILGHTNYNSKDDVDVQLGKKAQLHTRPSHAGIGAYIAQDILPELYDNDCLKSCISMAIARHHSPFTSECPDFKISDNNYQSIQRLLEEFELNVELKKQSIKDDLEGFEYDGDEEWLFYFYLVRILRLCDQKATDNLSNYFNEEKDAPRFFHK